MVRKKRVGWVVGVGAVALAGGLLLTADEQPQTSTKGAGPVKRDEQPRSSAFSLPQRDGLNRQRGDLFGGPYVPPPPKATPAQQAAAAQAANPEPVAPPMPYRVAGQVSHGNGAQVVLARDDRVYLVKEGDELDGGYRVESIRQDGVTLVYTPLDKREHLASATPLQIEAGAAHAIASAAPGKAPADAKPLPLADGRPAQLRWEGPSKVQAGSEFEVALKLTSEKPVRGSPLQLSYDAKLLEPVSVRAGDFFVDGSFTYRVNPTGMIFVGAFGKGEVAADAEFLVVTFKPIRAGTTAELKLSSLVLQGVGGSAVGHAPLAAFRTSITQ
jgi:type IV pilus biogenesis protein PilP